MPVKIHVPAPKHSVARQSWTISPNARPKRAPTISTAMKMPPGTGNVSDKGINQKGNMAVYSN